MNLNISIIGIAGSGHSLVSLAPFGPAASILNLPIAYPPEEIFGQSNLPLISGGQVINYRTPSTTTPGGTAAPPIVTRITPLHNLSYFFRLSSRMLKQPPSFLTAWKKPALITFCQSLKPTLSVAGKRVQCCILSCVTLRPGFNNDECSA